MSIENEEYIDSTNDEVVEVETSTEEQKETTKATGESSKFETPEAKKARLERQLEQFKKKHPDLYQEEKPKSTKSDSVEFDYGQKAFLKANGVEPGSEQELALSFVKETGKTLEQVLASKYFQAELTELRETKATENAIPSNSKRSNQSSKDEVDYWIAKGELPPVDQVELRRAVVNRRMEKESKTGVFYNSNK